MEEGRPSSTAIAVAIARAAHLLWDDPPKIFEDTVALRLCGCKNEAELRVRFDEIVAEAARSTRPDFAKTAVRYAQAAIIMRSRYVEDEVDLAITQGVLQYVILGGGLDSFAYRRTDLAKVLRVFEVDHPASQTWKRARLQELVLAFPANLAFVPLDFEKQSLIEALQRNGYCIEAPAFFSWLGVTMFLTPDAIFNTLRTVASLAPGTEIIFQYSVPAELLDEETKQVRAFIMAASAARNEPLLSFFEPNWLAEELRKLGFAEVWDLGPEEANRRYFAGRTDGLQMSVSEHFMGARVGPRSN